MADYKYKLKEVKVGDVSYSDTGTKSTVTNIDPETGRIEWSVEEVPDFNSVFKNLKKAKDFMDALAKNKDVRSDEVLRQVQQDLTKTFNELRTHVRKNYPEEYARIKMVAETSMSGGGTAGASFSAGEGEQYATPFAFNKNKKAKGTASNYYYKLGFKPVPEKVPGSGLEVKQLFKEINMYNYKLSETAYQPQSVAQFQNNRMLGFDAIEDLLGQIRPLLDDAKAETEKYYKENPKSYAVVYGTDLIQDYLKDIISTLKNSDDENSTNSI